jgi:hypothetical protein
MTVTHSCEHLARLGWVQPIVFFCGLARNNFYQPNYFIFFAKMIIVFEYGALDGLHPSYDFKSARTQ